jgi:phytanoyl-CoA hydroxylase
VTAARETLSAEQRQRYRDDGFLLLRERIDAATLEQLNARFCGLVRGTVPVPESLVIMRDVAFARGRAQAASALHAVNKILSFEDDPVLWPFACDERVIGPVRDLVGPELNTLSTNVFNKPPGVDGRHPLHQDLRYFALRPADRIVGTWTAMQACTRESGCLAVIPGSHRRDLAEHVEPDWEEVNFGFFAASGVDRTARVHMEMLPGDTLLLHPLLVHGSGRNRSDAFRRAISVHYGSVECRRPESMTGRRNKTRRIATVVKRVP